MANPYFQFKKFTVWHKKCAMKVGTDAVLLGAWVNAENCKQILDVGTGTGIIALMLAQRSQSNIDAIDIDEDATLQAKKNVAGSPFYKRISVYHSPFAVYASTCQKKYDLIISNPPYFINSMKCPDNKRTMARHTDSLLLNDLVESAKKLLASAGRIALILPFEQQDEIKMTAQKNNLWINRETKVIPTPNANPKRVLVELSATRTDTIIRDTLTIEENRHQYTPEYITLTKEFYLKM